MPTYWYRALGQGGLASEGTVVAGSRREALQRLVSGGQHPLDLHEQKTAAETASPTGFRLGRRAIRLATLTRQLATLSESGVPIVKSLNVLIEQQRDLRARHILTDVRESIQSGNTFAEALAKHPNTFPKLMTSMVSVGEKGGTLDQQLIELSGLYENEEALRGEVVAAIAYPALVLLVGLASTVILVAFFIPKLEEFFLTANEGLPLPTRILLGISHFVTAYRWVLVVLLALVPVGWRAAKRDERWRLVLDRWKLRVPYVGTLLRNLAVARLTRLLGTLARGGISIVEALEIVQPAIGNDAIARSVANIATRVRTGESLATLMKEEELFPPLSVQMVAVGEETGRLDQMLLSVADAYDRETTASTKVMTSMLAPALILVVAGLVGFILVAILLPIFMLSTVMT